MSTKAKTTAWSNVRAKRMAIPQPTISALESGDLDRSGLATLKAYVEALGGTVEVTATFGSRKLLVSSHE